MLHYFLYTYYNTFTTNVKNSQVHLDFPNAYVLPHFVVSSQNRSDCPQLHPFGQTIQDQQQGIAVDAIHKSRLSFFHNSHGFLGDSPGRNTSGLHPRNNFSETVGVAGVVLGFLTEAFKRIGRRPQHSRIDRARAKYRNVKFCRILSSALLKSPSS